MMRVGRARLVFIAVLLLASAIDLLAASLLRQPGLSCAARLACALMPLPGDIALIVLALIFYGAGYLIAASHYR